MGNNLYDNLLKATNNIDDITTEKYGVITKLDGIYCSVKETDNDLEHNNVPILNGANLSVGDKVILGFLNNSIYDVVCYGALDKTVHDDSKQDLLISGTNIKTINHTSLLGSGNIDIQGGGSDVDIVTSWEPTPSDTKVPSEKLTKNTLDTKVDKVTGKGLSTNDFTNSYKNTIDGLSTVATTGDYDDLTDKPTIPSKISDLTNDSDFIEKSSTTGLVKNDGTIDTTSYSTFSGSYNDLSGKPTIPSASTTTPSADTTSGSYGSGTNYARSNHTHPKSSLYAEATHSHTKSQITDFPTIPTKTSDLTNDGDGTNAFLTQHQSLVNYVQKSSISGLLKNDGSVDTTQYLSSLPSHNHDDRYYTESEVDTALNGKQATLISGTNIKTINNTSLLGSGNINIQGGGTVTIDDSLSTTSTNPVQNKVITGALNGKANSSHTHTKSEITDFPSIPSKTSDLVNDGDGSNVFVKDNDSRLSNARTPLAHTHLSSDVTDLIDVIYPVGSIYMSVNSVNPSTLFGGTWEQIKDTFLLSSGDTYSNGATGGSATVSLSESQMPRHNHSTNAHSHSTSDSGEYYVTSTQPSANNTRVAYSSSGNRMVDGFNTTNSIFHHRANTNSQSPTTKYTGGSGTTESASDGSAHENMPPYIVVNVWKRTA